MNDGVIQQRMRLVGTPIGGELRIDVYMNGFRLIGPPIVWRPGDSFDFESTLKVNVVPVVDYATNPGYPEPPPKREASPVPTETNVWCDHCTAYTAKVVSVDSFGGEVLHCPVCRTTWAHP